MGEDYTYFPLILPFCKEVRYALKFLLRRRPTTFSYQKWPKMTNKIPCSVQILIRNNEKTLERALDSVKDFAEIIVFDGNSRDQTLEIAKRYNCKIYRQYEIDEPTSLLITLPKYAIRAFASVLYWLYP